MVHLIIYGELSVPFFELRKLREEITNGNPAAFTRLVARAVKANASGEIAQKELDILHEMMWPEGSEALALEALSEIAKMPHNTGCKNEYRNFTASIDIIKNIGGNEAADLLEGLMKSEIYPSLTGHQKEALTDHLAALGELSEVTNIKAIELAAFDNRIAAPGLVKRLVAIHFGTEREAEATTAIINIGAKSERVFLAPAAAFLPTLMPIPQYPEVNSLRGDALKALIIEFIRQTDEDGWGQSRFYASSIMDDLDLLESPEALQTIADIAAINPAELDQDIQRQALGFFKNAAEDKLKELLQIAAEQGNEARLNKLAPLMMQAYTPVANENPSAKDAYKNIELLDAALRSHEFLTKITKQSLPITAQGFYSTTAKSLLGALTRPETLNAYLDNAEDQGEKLRTLFEKTISSKLLDTDTLNAIKTTFEAVSQSRTHWQQAQENHARVMGGALDLNADPA